MARGACDFDLTRFMAKKNGAMELLHDADQSFGRTPLQTEGVGEMPEDQIHWRSARVRAGFPDPRLHLRARCAIVKLDPPSRRRPRRPPEPARLGRL